MDSQVFWTERDLARLVDAPFPAKISELLDYAKRNVLPVSVVQNLGNMLEELEENGFEDVEYPAWINFATAHGEIGIDHEDDGDDN